MTFLRLFLVIGWLLLLSFTVLVAARQGLVGLDLFFADIAALSWRGVFNVDFICHLLLLALWVMWRHRFSPAGILYGVLCLCGGALFSFIYLLAAGVQAKGEIRALLLGRNMAAVE